MASGFWREFKGFALKGNIVDLAVAVIIGQAFGAVVSSLVEDLLMPLVGSISPARSYEAWQIGPMAPGGGHSRQR